MAWTNNKQQRTNKNKQKQPSPSSRWVTIRPSSGSVESHCTPPSYSPSHSTSSFISFPPFSSKFSLLLLQRQRQQRHTRQLRSLQRQIIKYLTRPCHHHPKRATLRIRIRSNEMSILVIGELISSFYSFLACSPSVSLCVSPFSQLAILWVDTTIRVIITPTIPTTFPQKTYLFVHWSFIIRAVETLRWCMGGLRELLPTSPNCSFSSPTLYWSITTWPYIWAFAGSTLMIRSCWETQHRRLSSHHRHQGYRSFHVLVTVVVSVALVGALMVMIITVVVLWAVAMMIIIIIYIVAVMVVVVVVVAVVVVGDITEVVVSSRRETSTMVQQRLWLIRRRMEEHRSLWY